MAKEIVMPALGMAQETGIVQQWFKHEGDTVVKGEPLMMIETDKVTVEIEAPESGVLVNVTAAEGDEVPVGQAIGRIISAAEAKSQLPGKVLASDSNTRPKRGPKVSPVAARMAAAHGVDLPSVPSSDGRIRKTDVQNHLAETAMPTPALSPASPKARRLAREHGLELAEISGSGWQRAVLAVDVTAAAQRRRQMDASSPAGSEIPEADAGVQKSDLPHAWRVMANRTATSWREAPHFFLLRDVDGRRLREWRNAAQAGSQEKITYTDLLIKLVAISLRQHQQINSHWQDDQIIVNPDINICLAVAISDGLITPVFHKADTLNIDQIAVRRRQLVEQARKGTLQPSDLKGGTFTISNLGMYGIDAFFAIINPPQAAILAVGRLGERVVPVDGMAAVRLQMTLSLSCDHRVIDGARGAQFLATLAELITEPLNLLT